MKNIVFMTLEELEEAVKFGVIEKRIIINYLSGSYHVPVLFFNDLNNHTSNSDSSIANIWSKPKYIKCLQNSVMWADIREKYRPKEWYELEENEGKAIMVRDEEGGEWKAVGFRGYSKDEEFKFASTNGICYRYARLVTPDDIAKEK